ncbi:MAG: precorrin-8X methylmutase [Cyanobacteria bacterium J06598_1]
MPDYLEHEITLASFAQIDQEIGTHRFSPAEYAIVRRVIHTTADFEFRQLLQFSSNPIMAAATALSQSAPIVTDVSMVAAGIRTVVDRTWGSSVVAAVQQAPTQLPPNQTRSAAGMRQCLKQYSGAIIAVGNAPTALLTLCEAIASEQVQPALVVGAPVGFINVVESKQALAALSVPHILVSGRKGGSAVAAAILNALMIWTWQQSRALPSRALPS